jgi:hypothetical protein
VATLVSGARVTTGSARGAYTQVTLDGFVSADLLGGARDNFGLSVRDGGARLRSGASTSSSIVAELRGGAGLSRVSRRGTWVQVRRSGWVLTKSLKAPVRATAPKAAPRAAPPKPAAVAARPSTQNSAGGRTGAAAPQGARAPQRADSTRAAASQLGGTLSAPSMVAMRAGPDGRELAEISAGTTMEPLARERGWVRVRLEGWVPESAVVPADTSVRSDLSAADVRSDPQRMRGTIVRWRVQLLALQAGDGLRRSLAVDEPYLLARGPDTESALLYVAVPVSLLESARSLAAAAPLTVTITARVRDGRSEPVGVPVLELLTMVR